MKVKRDVTGCLITGILVGGGYLQAKKTTKINNDEIAFEASLPSY